jgi:glucan phosphorylase
MSPATVDAVQDVRSGLQADALRQEAVSAAWRDTEAWTRMSILNTARSGKFSSDRAITEYCDDIWNVPPVTVKV